MKKKILCLIATLVLMVGMPITAKAEAFKSTETYGVTFDGNKIESNFTTGQMAYEVSGILPGDTMEILLTIKNESNKATDWYMANEILESFEDNSKANGGAYTYVLTYRNPAGSETILYDSETVGGEGASKVSGLHQATQGLTEYFYLDRLDAGTTAHVYLVVKLEGETQGNSYQNTLAKLQMTFAVEEVGSPQTIYKTPKTGDYMNTLIFVLFTLISGFVILIFAMNYTRNKSQRKKGE